jgi:hypothetical protein
VETHGGGYPIIRDGYEYQRIRVYNHNNPAKWEEEGFRKIGSIIVINKLIKYPELVIKNIPSFPR